MNINMSRLQTAWPGTPGFRPGVIRQGSYPIYWGSVYWLPGSVLVQQGQKQADISLLITRSFNGWNWEEVWFCPYMNSIARIVKKNMKNSAAVRWAVLIAPHVVKKRIR